MPKPENINQTKLVFSLASMAVQSDVEVGQINYQPYTELSSTKICEFDVEFGQDTQLPLESTMNLMSDERRQEYLEYGISLYRASLHGDWKTARQIHKEHPNCFIVNISKYGDTALHIAAAGGHSNFVKQALAQAKFTEEQLELRNNVGNTAFCLAAASGAMEIVKEMERRNPKLPYVRGSSDLPPILMAALLGHKDMVMLLLPCFDNLTQEERIDLLISTINTDLYDVALQILEKDDSLATVRNGDGETPLYVLARKPRTQNSKFYKIFVDFCGVQADDPAKLQLVESLWDKVIQQPERVISDVLSSPQPQLLFVAIENGNHELAAILIHRYPDLIWEIDDECRTIFHAAIQFRQEKIFGHIYEIDGINHLLTAQKNPTNGNNILHLAATLPPSNRLNAVSGAALQMQQELLWFQVVKETVQPEYVNLKNNDADTPRALFTNEHKKLRKEGEKWMRSTAISCMLVATLVALVVFQHPTFQVPKSMHYNYNNSSSLVMLEAFSLLASASSILTFLSILSSRFAEEDFLKLLPLKLIAGLLLLFFSIITMMLTFTVTVFTIFQHQVEWIVIVILGWVTCTFYIRRHLLLLVDVLCSTFGSRYLFRPRSQLF